MVIFAMPRCNNSWKIVCIAAGFNSHVQVWVQLKVFHIIRAMVQIACEQAIQGALVVGQKGRESLQSHLWNLNSIPSAPGGSLSTEQSDFGQLAKSRNKCQM